MSSEVATRRAPGVAPRVAVVGCGAIAEMFHLPALAREKDVMRNAVLVDLDRARAERLAIRFGAREVTPDFSAALKGVSAVILTVPHHLHYPMALESLRQGCHVLCEKPLAESEVEAMELAQVAENNGVAIAVNHTMRLYPSCQRTRELIRDGAIGEPTRLAFFMGEKFDWPAASGFYVGAGGNRRGVLLDKGPHALDLVCWWLGGRPTVERFEDDSGGGIEAVASVHLRLGRCKGEVHLSWLSRYENGYRIEGTHGAVEAALYDWQTVTLIDARGKRSRLRLKTAVRDPAQFATTLISNFLATVRGEAEPLIPGKTVADSVALIEQCYARRERYRMPWQDVSVKVPGV